MPPEIDEGRMQQCCQRLGWKSINEYTFDTPEGILNLMEESKRAIDEAVKKGFRRWILTQDKRGKRNEGKNGPVDAVAHKEII